MINKKNKGFTIIEVLFVVVIVSILMAVSIPIYRDYIVEVKREYAQNSLMELSERMHKVKNKTFSFANAVSGLRPLPNVYPDRVTYNGETIYLLFTVGVTANKFTLYAVPTGDMAGNGLLRLVYLNNNLTGRWDALKNGTYTESWY